MKKILLIKEESSIKIGEKDVKNKRDDAETLFLVLKTTGTKDTSDFRSKLKLKKVIEKLLCEDCHEDGHHDLVLGLPEFKTLNKILDEYKAQVLKQGNTVGDDVMQVMVQIEDAEQLKEEDPNKIPPPK